MRPQQSALAAALWFFVSVAPQSAASMDNRDVKRFLESMDRSVPVTGTFTLSGSTDHEFAAQTEKFAAEFAERRGLAVEAQPGNTAMKCRWSTDGTTELLEPLGKGNIWRSFFRTPQALLEGNTIDNYNLMAPKDPYPIRPGSFYQFFGPDIWDSLVRDSKAIEDSEQLEACEAKRSPDSCVFGIRVKRASFLVHSSTEDGRLLSAESYFDDRLFRRLSIEAFIRGDDGKFFPKRAKIEVFAGSSEKPVRIVHLESHQVEWPVTARETDAALTMTLRAGTAVLDLVRDQKAVLTRPTSAAAIINDRSLFEPMDGEAALNVSSSHSSSFVASRGVFIAVNVAVVCIVVLAIYLRRGLSRMQ